MKKTEKDGSSDLQGSLNRLSPDNVMKNQNIMKQTPIKVSSIPVKG